MTTRKEKRDHYAHELCREVRFQLSNFGFVKSNEEILYLLKKWMDNSGKNKYNRPVLRGKF